MVRSIKKFSVGVLLASLALQPGSGTAENIKTSRGIPPQTAAEYIHSVIEADRTIYSEVIVERLAVTLSLPATENWQQEKTLMLPAQFLLESSRQTKKRGIGMTYELKSLWPINKENGPGNALEKKALRQVAENPEEPFTTVVNLKGDRVFKAVFPDKAVTKACVTCHNQHPESPKTDFRLGEVMGGIIINLPLHDTHAPDETDRENIPPEVVSDYIHSVLESDRTVYSELIVNRLQQNNIIYASENWWENNALPLPAQFLLNASDLILNKDLGLDFKLISLWPINPRNRPANAFERRGLEYVVRHPVRPYVSTLRIGGKPYFYSVYPDFAVTEACVTCHNGHPQSPKRDFEQNDVMGGLVLTFPLE